MLTKAPKGTRDILPSEIHRWHHLESAIRGVCEAFCYHELRIPVFEHTELFSRGVGETTDVVQKEMYTFADKAGRSLTLRPEGTAGAARAFIENGMSSLAMPQKMYYLGPMYRYENVQRGRYREFRQFGCEVFGAAGPESDVELISLLKTLFERLGLTETDLRINSIGCPACRPEYMRRLREYLEPRLGGLCSDCRERYARNPLRVIDCKNTGCRAQLVDAPMALDHLCGECAAHFEGLKSGLAELGISYTVDRSIVRGLDYYSRTVFEFASRSITTLGAAICGGGRYDGLIGLCGGPDTPGVGFAVGLERLLMEIESNGIALPEPAGVELFLIASGERARTRARRLTYSLRAVGRSVDTDALGRSVKAQMKYADKRHARYTAVIGDDELERGTVALREMAGGATTELPLEGFCERFCELTTDH